MRPLNRLVAASGLGTLAVAAAALLLAVLAPAPAAAAELLGRVRLLQDGKPVARADFGGAVVWLTPRSATAPKPPAAPLSMATKGKEFSPHVLVVPAGARVRFPNLDPILHNVFSVSGKNSFDVGLYGRGEGEEVVLGHPGVVRVFCNVHHSMVGYLVVVETAHHAVPAADGGFRFVGVPAGPATLAVWHERAEPVLREVTLPASGELTIDLELSRPRVPQHLNKFGKPYRREGRRAY